MLWTFVEDLANENSSKVDIAKHLIDIELVAFQDVSVFVSIPAFIVSIAVVVLNVYVFINFDNLSLFYPD